MVKEKNRKTTTIAVSKKTFSKLFDIRHDLELKDRKDYSYNKIIEFLIESYEK